MKEQAKAEGIKEGIKEGRLQGDLRRAETGVKNMLKKGMTPKEISELLEVSFEFIDQVKKNL